MKKCDWQFLTSNEALICNEDSQGQILGNQGELFNLCAYHFEIVTSILKVTKPSRILSHPLYTHSLEDFTYAP